ncbi:ice-binding family protein [Psychromonas antarctica]|uniref:ice-binding family protein n=1 Tax=Psychromonas antarctica TaxID=67573 RepID=UPI001EE85FF5|nr:ice-binding family protein [Psychromonas antarctica]MCG6202138.1 ice-binding family protein [Psychromonas antarctica]
MNKKSNYFNPTIWASALVLLTSLTGCNNINSTPPVDDTTAPMVESKYPADSAGDVVLNRSITVKFNKVLDLASLNESSFTLSDGTNNVAGDISFQETTATFNPANNLLADTLYTVTLTTAIIDLAEPANAMAENVVWHFMTGTAVAAGPAPVNLRTAGDFAILSKTGITNIPASAIIGDIGASPITAAAMDNVFCSEMKGGTIYGSDAAYTGSGAINCFKGAAADNTLVANAVLDMGLAYQDAAGRTLPDFTELHAGDISGKTLVPGLYKWSSGLLISTDVTLSGGANDVWIFQVAGDITQADASSIVLAGGATAKNIFWQVGGGSGVAIGTNAHFEGIVLAEKGITVNTDTAVTGRLLSQTAVTLDHNAVTEPAL